MKKIAILIEKELKHYFYSPIAYVVMMVFLTLSGYFFYAGLRRFGMQYTYFKSYAQALQNPEILQRFNLNEMVIAPAVFNMIFIFLFMIPLIMMRSFAEEKNQKTDELLKTAPITPSQVVWGKYLGSLSFVFIMILPTILYQVVLFTGLDASPELGPVVTAYLGVFMFAAAGVAIGLFASAMTENQIIAAVITFVILLLLFIINFIGLDEGNIMGDILKYISVSEHVKDLLRGMLDTRDVVYFASISGLFLFLTHRALDSEGWRA